MSEASAGHEPIGHDHGPGGHAHSHTANANARQLTLALALTSAFLVAEVIGGLVFGSLALLSDAAHMFTDTAALAIALAAIKIGQRKADERRTFGYRRFEILAAAFNAVLLFGVALYVLIEGARRIFEPAPVQSTGMLIVAGLGLAVNLISMRVLAGGKDKSLNVKGAYLEVWADMVGSVGVIAGALVIQFTGWSWVDPVVAIAIGLWVLPRTWVLLRDSTNILLEGAPSGIALAGIRTTIAETPGVAGVHDLHLWVSGADQPSCTAHVVLAAGADGESVRRHVAARLEADFDVHHVTIQTETAPCDAAEPLHP
ncbi:cobalt-zinc-cadmium resistance protein CzcD [Phenylobacterium zucineum HLK1]|uniref:Cobalt-zinc-cadmium resistance protein CzcD n=1 Tax=Phenylobacterium zucineum (strain HLK1) TaxID=450851 RepID=B4R9T3_PHEZH|nr:cation diffusion facilitator family transporter [Phenylobacterium zucineum]ACG77847.1 cobalt-zinc-cadmium resistance protein CzcD [Phenylobacterium zucineum HLK1]